MTGNRELMFMFPGQGSQHARMAQGLYGNEPTFTSVFDFVIKLYGPEGEAARRDWLSDRPTRLLDRPSRSQLLLFAIDYSLGRAMLARGHEPSIMLGHSIGEVAAACLAEVMSVEDVADLVRQRMQRLEDAPPGGMIAVAATAGAVRDVLTDQLVIGAYNAPRQVVLSGPEEDLACAALRLEELGLSHRRVPSQTGFHSPMLSPYVAESLERFRRIRLAEPSRIVYSCYQPGTLDSCAPQPDYWASHPVEPVRFWSALDEALTSSDASLTVVELGPGGGLTTLARRHPQVRSGRHNVVSALPLPPTTPSSDRDAWQSMLEVVG